MKNDLIKIIITALITLMCTLIIQKIQNRTRILEYKIDKQENIIKKPYQVNEKLKIYLDSNKIDNLSTLRLAIYNSSGRPLNDLDLFFELEPTHSEKIDILNENYFGQDFSDEFVVPIKKEPSKYYKNGIKLGYRIKVANSNNDFEPVFVVEYIFKNDNIPNISKPTFINAGIGSEEFNINHYVREREVKNIIISFLLTIAIVFVVFFTSGRIIRRNEVKKRLEVLKFLVERFKCNQKSEYQKLVNPARTIAYLESERDLYYYNKPPRWINWFFGFRIPKPLKEEEIDKIHNENK